MNAAIPIIEKVRGRRMRYKDKPLAFSAVNSLFSVKFPIVIIDDKRTANGKAKGIKLAET